MRKFWLGLYRQIENFYSRLTEHTNKSREQKNRSISIQAHRGNFILLPI
jgi:hypothetical protein